MARTRKIDENGNWIVYNSQTNDKISWRSRDALTRRRELCYPPKALESRPDDPPAPPPDSPQSALDDIFASREGSVESTIEYPDGLGGDQGVFTAKFPIDYYSTKSSPARPTEPVSVPCRPGMPFTEFYTLNRDYISYTESRIRPLLEREVKTSGVEGYGSLLHWKSAPHQRPTINQITQASLVLGEGVKFDAATGCGDVVLRRLFGRSLGLAKACYEAEGRYIARGVKELGAFAQYEAWDTFHKKSSGQK